ncbi:hypothetical protein ACFDR9_003241 [Janthinobacterium sp. CG_23.3]|uniref:hypothetical protein n=1 Tax=Janthinobacterium sp. CG_23.3 TaxID=3349634 RepID=UPI0038D39B61
MDWVVSGTDFLHSNWSMPDGQACEGRKVAVYGGSATAAWVVEMAMLRKMIVTIWFKRPGAGNLDEQFADAFPPGSRNNVVQEKTAALREIAFLSRVEIAKDITLELVIHKDSHPKIVPETQHVDVLVYALGAGHTTTDGIPRIVCQQLAKQLIPFYDMNMAISKKPALLALGTPGKELMIVGSAMATERAGFGAKSLPKYLSEQEIRQKQIERELSKLATYVDIGKSLPAAARPTQGVALLMAAIEALNDFMPGEAVRFGQYRHRAGQSFHPVGFDWNINFNTFNRTQLAAYFADTEDIDVPAANLAVALIVHVRTLPDFPMGITLEHVYILIEAAKKCAKDLPPLSRALLYKDAMIECLTRDLIRSPIFRGLLNLPVPKL